MVPTESKLLEVKFKYSNTLDHDSTRAAIGMAKDLIDGMDGCKTDIKRPYYEYAGKRSTLVSITTLAEGQTQECDDAAAKEQVRSAMVAFNTVQTMSHED